MIILQTHEISKSFVIDPILHDINIQIQSNDRVGLVGINGAGKSTLLKIIASKILPDSGEIHIAKGTKIGYLAQDSGLETERMIWDEMIMVFSHLITKEDYIRSLEQKMADPLIIKDAEKYEQLMNQYSRVRDDFRDEGGYSYEAKIRGVLHGLGFNSFDYHKQPIHTLSGGQKTRLALAKLLLEEPNLLILDEPTNYLDVETLTWLEGYLKSYSGAILVVSHDRYFLDTLVNVIYEIEKTKATKYVGNYSKYLEQKAKNLELTMKNYEKQQSEIMKLEDFVNRNIARASTTRRAQSRRKALEKIDKIERPSTNQKKASFTFDTDTQSGNNVLMVKDLSIAFDENTLFENVTFTANRQERIALIGPNGIGKSTLLKLINKHLKPKEGSFEYGSNVKIGFYYQEQDNLNYKKTVIDELWDDHPNVKESEIRTILGNFLFVGDDVFKQIKDLSGGEKARVNLAKLMMQKANFLLLDEPTNHLDIFSREVLENALKDYPGTILFISHDRYFLNMISTRTIELTPSGVNSYLGNYDYLLEKKAELEEIMSNNPSTKEEKNNKDKYLENRRKQNSERQLRRNIESLELEIEQLETEIEKLEKELLQPEVYSNHRLSYEKNEELNQIKIKLEQSLAKWEEIHLELEI